MLKSKHSDLILGVQEMLNFSFFDYLKFMPSPQLFDLIPQSARQSQSARQGVLHPIRFLMFWDNKI